MKRSSIFAWIGFGIVAAAAAGAAVFANRVHKAAGKKDEIPLVAVKRGDINMQVHSSAELRASHAMMLSAPAVGGDALQIIQLVRTGQNVKKGDVIVEFDPTEQQYKLEQNKSEMEQAEQEITKAKADALVLTAEDKVALLKDRYGVSRAESDVKKRELVSKIDADKNDLALVQAKRVLEQLQKDIESHKASGQASIFLAQEKSNKAKIAMEQAQQNLEKMRVTAPMDGLVSIQKNVNASGGLFFTGMSLPDYHPGDQVQPGSAIAQIVDPLGMDLVSKVSEQEHSNIQSGQAVQVTFDALPGHIFQGTVKTVSGMSAHEFFETSTGGNFDVAIQLANPDPHLHSGFTAQVVFLGDTKKNVLYIPRQAIFLKDGKPIVYTRNVGGYTQHEIKIQNETESRAAIAGLDEGTQVALIDPTAPQKATSGSSASGGMEGAP